MRHTPDLSARFAREATLLSEMRGSGQSGRRCWAPKIEGDVVGASNRSAAPPAAPSPARTRRLRLLELRANPLPEARTSSRQAVADQRPHPADLLALPALRAFTGRGQFLAMRDDLLPSSGRPSFVSAEQVSTGGVQLGDAGVIRWIARR